MDIWSGIGIGTEDCSAACSGVCRCLLASCKVSLSSPKPLITPVTTQQQRFAAYLRFIPDRGAADHLRNLAGHCLECVAQLW
jgi:hypothetical protein